MNAGGRIGGRKTEKVGFEIRYIPIISGSRIRSKDADSCKPYFHEYSDENNSHETAKSAFEVHPKAPRFFPSGARKINLSARVFIIGRMMIPDSVSV